MIGTAKSSDDFEPIVRIYDRRDKLQVFYVEDQEGSHHLTRYNLLTGKSDSIRAPTNIVDVSVSQNGILIVLQGMELGLLNEDSFDEKVMKFDKTKHL